MQGVMVDLFAVADVVVAIVLAVTATVAVVVIDLVVGMGIVLVWRKRVK